MDFFRVWGKFWAGKPSSGTAVLDKAAATATPLRRDVWKAYFITLSRVLQQGLPYSSATADFHWAASSSRDETVRRTPMRLQQCFELYQVQTVYEDLLLQEVRFPKADADNGKMEEWAESVMSNWRVLCGSSWQDSEVGQGGKETLSRLTLDVCEASLNDETILIQFVDSLPCRETDFPFNAHSPASLYCAYCPSRIRHGIQSL